MCAMYFHVWKRCLDIYPRYVTSYAGTYLFVQSLADVALHPDMTILRKSSFPNDGSEHIP